jgi:DmsE family decaheme c-type cytochrome
MNNKNILLVAKLLLLTALFSGPLPAQQQPATSSGDTAAEYTEKGADTCVKCHDEESVFPVYSIFKTKHAQRTDPRTPFASLQCETCHGPGGKHAQKVRPGHKRPPIINFGAKSALTPQQQNHVCLQCHETDARIAWQGSPHESNDVACVNCHRIHIPKDPVLTTLGQPEVCYKCHKTVRADFYKPNVHPVRFGKMTCTDCHNTHSSDTVGLLKKPTLNQTCYMCHAEKRGPFLWEHPPVPENCTLCHSPHGSIQPALLVKRPPLLCQQCHTQAGHPSLAFTPAGLPPTPSGFLLAGSCLNCHSQIHGSNDPSGARLMR